MNPLAKGWGRVVVEAHRAKNTDGMYNGKIRLD
jgi:hypothetical protein